MQAESVEIMRNLANPDGYETYAVDNLAMAHFGETIKRLREARRWSQDELAAQADVSMSTVQKWEKREQPPSRAGRNYRAIATALDLSPDQLDAEWKGGAKAQAEPPAAQPTLDDVIDHHRRPMLDLGGRIIEWFRRQPDAVQSDILALLMPPHGLRDGDLTAIRGAARRAEPKSSHVSNRRSGNGPP